ncbi:MAG TPA: hypothetical protein VEY13_02960, partial [Rubrobacteraceae bacterium]|nr:hypothetical protein [Rubrobacteraceae bacterium]
MSRFGGDFRRRGFARADMVVAFWRRGGSCGAGRVYLDAVSPYSYLEFGQTDAGNGRGTGGGVGVAAAGRDRENKGRYQRRDIERWAK